MALLALSFSRLSSELTIATYVDNASGTLMDRHVLLRLLSDAEPGDVLLAEAVHRLSRLDQATREELRDRIVRAGLRLISYDSACLEKRSQYALATSTAFSTVGRRK